MFCVNCKSLIENFIIKELHCIFHFTLEISIHMAITNYIDMDVTSTNKQ